MKSGIVVVRCWMCEFDDDFNKKARVPNFRLFELVVEHFCSSQIELIPD